MFLPIIIYFIRLTLSVLDLCDNYSTFAYIFAIFIQIVCNICTPEKSSPFSTFFTKNLFFMIILQNRRSESYHKIPLFLTSFYVDNVDNLVYKSLFALKSFFLMWITFFDPTCTFSAIWSCILRSLCKLSTAAICRSSHSFGSWAPETRCALRSRSDQRSSNAPHKCVHFPRHHNKKQRTFH